VGCRALRKQGKRGRVESEGKGRSLACSWDTRIHMRHDRMRVCARECMPVACVRALVRGCVCVSVCVGGATGRTIHTRTQMHTGTDRDTRAWAYMMTDLALLAWPPQVPRTVRQSAEHPAGDGLQRTDQPHVSRGEREGVGRGKRAREGGGGIRDRRGESVCFDMSVSASGCLCV